MNPNMICHKPTQTKMKTPQIRANLSQIGLAGGMILVIPRPPAPAILQNHAILP